MATRPKFSEADNLERCRVALDNAVSQPTISAALSELGVDTAFIEEGKGILQKTRTAYDANKIEDNESSEAYHNFDTKRKELENIFKLDRKKAKVIFRKDIVAANKLGITNSLPRTYIRWYENLKNFYSVALSDKNLTPKFSRLGVTEEKLTATQAKITALEDARSKYLREKGESQASTQTKDAAFAELDDWMSEFFAIAKIALEDKPQLLESLGKFVKN